MTHIYVKQHNKNVYYENVNKNSCSKEGAYTEKYNTNNVYDERTTQQCSSGYCICAIGYVEKKDGIGYELPAAYGVDCSDKNYANSTQIFDSKSNKCVCSKKKFYQK